MFQDWSSRGVLKKKFSSFAFPAVKSVFKICKGEKSPV
jgi:hypothetical protein